MANGRMLRAASRWLRSNAPLAALITVLATLILQAAVSTVLEWSNALLIVTVVILSLLTILYLQEIRSYIATNLGTQPYIFSTGQTKEEIEEGYKKVTECIRAANKHILIVGADLTRTPQGKQAAARSDYLETIEQVVRTKVERGDSFTYKRIVQSAPQFVANELSSDHVDEATFTHCQNVAEETSDSDEVDFKLYIRKPIAACPAILVIDEEFVGLAIVGDNKVYDDQAEEYKYTRSIQGMVHITDRTNRLPAHYIRLFEKFAANEREVVGYDRGAYSTDQNY